MLVWDQSSVGLGSIGVSLESSGVGRSRFDPGSVQGHSRRSPGSVQSQSRFSPGSIRRKSGVIQESICGQFRAILGQITKNGCKKRDSQKSGQRKSKDGPKVV